MAAILDVPDWIDRQKISGTQIAVLLLCGLASALDGFDAQAIGYVAPAVIRDFKIPPHSFTPVFAWGLAGLLVGCLVIAPLADWIGRKKVMVGSAIFFGLMSLLTAGAHTLPSLTILRFLTGLGLGGSMPNAIALTAEFFPARNRATMTMAMFTGFPLGASLGGFLAAGLIASHGWPAVFIAGGILPLIFAAIFAVALPESVRHLVLKGGSQAAIAKALRRINPAADFPAGTTFVIREERESGLTIRHLFREGRTLGTLLLWVMFFMSLLDIFFLASWLPEVLHTAGLSISVAVVATALLQGGGVIAALSTGWMVDRFGFYVVLLPFYIGAALMIALIGFAGTAVTLIMVAAFLSGACVVGGQTAVNVLAAVYYPTYIRATGVGWGLGIGRAGSIVGPVVGGMMLANDWSRPSLFVAAAIPSGIAAIAVVIMAVTAGRRVSHRGSLSAPVAH